MITKVSYARLYNLGNYENERFEAEAEVVDGNVTRSARASRRSRPSASAKVAERERAEEQRREEWRAAEQRRRAQSATEEPDFR